jgi:uncharacterized protein YciI
MLVTFICVDKPGQLDLRLKVRPQHLEWLEKSGVAVTYAGPLLTDDGQTPIGSLIIADFESVAAARTFQKTDPYEKAGLFGQVTVYAARKVLPAA